MLALLLMTVTAVMIGYFGANMVKQAQLITEQKCLNSSTLADKERVGFIGVLSFGFTALQVFIIMALAGTILSWIPLLIKI